MELLRLSLSATSLRSARCAWNLVGQTHTQQAARPARESRVWRMGIDGQVSGDKTSGLRQVGKLRLETRYAGLAGAVLLQGTLLMDYCIVEVWEGVRGGRRSNWRASSTGSAHKRRRLASHQRFARIEKCLSRRLAVALDETLMRIFGQRKDGPACLVNA